MSRHNFDRGLHIVTKRETPAPSPFFHAGQSIPETGLYRVFHAEHRLSHEVILLQGEIFPRCSVCGNDVHFEQRQATPEIAKDPDFRSRRLFEIPHPEPEPPQSDVEVA